MQYCLFWHFPFQSKKCLWTYDMGDKHQGKFLGKFIWMRSNFNFNGDGDAGGDGARNILK